LVCLGLLLDDQMVRIDALPELQQALHYIQKQVALNGVRVCSYLRNYGFRDADVISVWQTSGDGVAIGIGG
jgi:hypothetical protein